MSKADQIFINNMKDIMENGFWDTDLKVRPHWEDGTPAHTVKKSLVKVTLLRLRGSFLKGMATTISTKARMSTLPN